MAERATREEQGRGSQRELEPMRSEPLEIERFTWKLTQTMKGSDKGEGKGRTRTRRTNLFGELSDALFFGVAIDLCDEVNTGIKSKGLFHVTGAEESGDCEQKVIDSHRDILLSRCLGLLVAT